MVLDFVKDEEGVYWLLNLRSFQLENPRIIIRQQALKFTQVSYTYSLFLLLQLLERPIQKYK